MTRVLLAEDDPLVRDALAEMLRTGGVEVVAVADAVDALSALTDTTQGYDAAVLDLTLGDHTETLHRALARAGVPVLLVSGRDPEALPAHATLHGWAYLAKPVEASALRDALDRIILTPEPEMSDPSSPDTSAVRQRPRQIIAPQAPVAVQVIDKLTSLCAVAVLGYLALHAKLTTEAGVLILAAVGVDSIPRGILAARSNGSAALPSGTSGAALGLIGLGLAAALQRTPAPAARPAPAATQASAIGAIVVLVALALAAMGCRGVREAAIDTQSQRVGCVALSHRCYDGAPQVCSAAGRWWPSMPPSPSGEPRRCASRCEVVDGVAGCSPEVQP